MREGSLGPLVERSRREVRAACAVFAGALALLALACLLAGDAASAESLACLASAPVAFCAGYSAGARRGARFGRVGRL